MASKAKTKGAGAIPPKYKTKENEMSAKSAKKVEVKAEFPNVLYIVVVDPNTDDECMLMWKSVEDVDIGDSNTENVGVYKLERVGKLVVAVS